MKILRVYPFLPPLPGGMEKHVFMLSQQQRNLGHDVVVAFNSGEVTNNNDIRLLQSLNLKRVRPQIIRDLIFYFSLCVSLVKNKVRFDVIHLHGDWSAFLFGRMLAKLCSANVSCCSIHGEIQTGRVKQVIYRIVLSQFDFVYCTGLSEYNFLKNFVKPRTSLYWQPSGIDASFKVMKSPVSDKFSYDVVTVGSLLPVKNHKLFIDVASKIPSLKFAVAGDGPLRTELESYIQELSISNVTLLGHISSHDVYTLMTCSKVFLLTSFSEGTSTAMLEAMSLSNVVVSTKSNDYSLLFGANERGIIVNSFDSSLIAKTILDILNNSDRFHELTIQAKLKSFEFYWNDVAINISKWMSMHNIEINL